MNRKKKLLIYILIILTFFSHIYFTQGYYISKNKAIEDALRYCSIEDNNVFATLDFDDDFYILGTTKRGEYIDIIDFDRIGPFYWYNGWWGREIYPNYDLNVTIGFTHDDTVIFYAYRVNKDIDHIEISISNGDKITCDEWHHDYIYTTYKKTDVALLYCEIKAYDANNNYIGSFGGGDL